MMLKSIFDTHDVEKFPTLKKVILTVARYTRINPAFYLMHINTNSYTCGYFQTRDFFEKSFEIEIENMIL